MNSKANNKSYAKSMLNEVIKYSRTIDAHHSDTLKKKLVKDVNIVLDEGVYNIKLPNYKMYASVQQIFDLCKKKKLTLDESLRKVELEDRICEYLVNNEPQKDKKFEASKKYDKLVLRLFVEGYNKEYRSKLTKNQKLLIKKLVESSAHDFKGHIKGVVNVIDEYINTCKNKSTISDNEVLKVKFAQTLDKWNNADKKRLTSSIISESTLETLMKYVGLIDEINS